MSIFAVEKLENIASFVKIIGKQPAFQRIWHSERSSSKMSIFAVEKLENIASFVKIIGKRPPFRRILTVRKIF